MESISRRLGPGNFGRLARRTNLDMRHVSRVCRGLREPSLDVAKRIADAAGVTLDEFYDHTFPLRQANLPQTEDEKVDRNLQHLGME